MGIELEAVSVRRTPDAPIRFLCNICDRENEASLASLTREDPTCSKCGSNVRLRSIVHILTSELFGHSLRLSQVPYSPELRGIGLSCWEGYARVLSRRVDYQNTFFHQEPHLDIGNADHSRDGALDFIISTDVFEHVAPPVASAFSNALRMLKPDGVLIFSVPFSHPGIVDQPTLEHYPDLYRYEIHEADGAYTLTNTTRDGPVQHFDNLTFHGGPGSTLEMRVFSESSLIDELQRAGFDDITIYSRSDLRHGIYWPHPWSVPMAARRTNGGRGNG